MKNFRRARKIPALFWTASLLGCLAFAACGDATPTNAVKTTPPLQAVAQITPFSPVAFEQVSPAAATTQAVTTAIPTTKLALTSVSTSRLAVTSAPPSTPPGNIRNNWLRGIPCKAPCWENITPGKTTPTEAQALLKQNPSIGKIQVEDPQFGDKPAAVYLFQADKVSDLGSISYHSEPEPAKIEIIKLEVDFYQPKEVFPAYGEPSHVIVIEKTNELGYGTGEYKTYLVYLNQGLILSSIYSKETALTPATVFNEVYFFIPGQAGLNILDTQGELNEKLLVGWEGFKDAKYYCRYQVQTGIKTC